MQSLSQKEKVKKPFWPALVIFLALGLVLIVVCSEKNLFLFNLKPHESSTSSSIASNSETVSVETYYVPVAGFSSSYQNLNFEEIKNSPENGDVALQIVIPLENREELLSIFQLGDFPLAVTTMPRTEIYDYLNAHSDIVSFLPWNEVDFRLKTLKINGTSLWEKQVDLEKYPLKFVSAETEDQSQNLPQYSSQNLIHLMAVGELILSRGVAERIIKYNDVLYPFRKVNAVLSSADFTLATLEAPLVENCVFARETMVFCGQPEYIAGLTFSGIDLVSLAANHIKDYGGGGIAETTALLDENKIAHVGAGQNREEAHWPYIAEIGNVKFGFLGYNDVVPESYGATSESAGSAWAEIDEISADIANLRPQVDVILVLMHWGIEYTNKPSERQNEIAHAAISAGVDIIIGDHPHWVQGVEFYGGKFIVYGVGNFVFDQMWSQETREGTIVDLFFYQQKLINVSFRPTVIEDYAQPRLATQEESTRILERIWETSEFVE